MPFITLSKNLKNSFYFSVESVRCRKDRAEMPCFLFFHKIISIKWEKYLCISKKSSTFAGAKVLKEKSFNKYYNLS